MKALSFIASATLVICASPALLAQPEVPAPDDAGAPDEAPSAEPKPAVPPPPPAPTEEEDEDAPPPPPAAEKKPAAAPETAPPAQEPRAAKATNENGAGLGLNPALPQYGAEVAGTSRPGDMPAIGGGGLEIHGYLRAPMRVGVGDDNDGSGSGSELHAPPRVPDASFTDWRYIDNLPGPWAEILFSYGTPRAKGTLSIASYNQSIAGYRELQAQLGVNQAFVALNFPGSLGPNGDVSLTVGSFSNRYGTMGKYDAGMYETYLFGRTRVAGETLALKYYVTPDVSLHLEHGIGAKLDVIPFEQPMPRPEYLPYPGPVPQGSTFLHHAHAGIGLGKKLKLGGHYLTAFTPDDHNAPGTESRKGRMSIYGGEIRFNGDVFGDGYAGYSHIDASHILPLADAIEVLHSSGGWQFKNNFFGRFNPRTGMTPADDSGEVDSVAFQYALSLGKIARYPTRFGGNGPDLTLTLFGMFNSVSSDTQSHDKLKYGADLFYSAFDALGLGVRYDLVQPNLDDNDQSFAVLSPRIVLRSAFVAHERVTLAYSRYFNGSEAYPAFPYAAQDEGDSDVVMIAASMWW